jgi:hypothetical protein
MRIEQDEFRVEWQFIPSFASRPGPDIETYMVRLVPAYGKL